MLDDLFAAGYAFCILMILLAFVNFPV